MLDKVVVPLCSDTSVCTVVLSPSVSEVEVTVVTSDSTAVKFSSVSGSGVVVSAVVVPSETVASLVDGLVDVESSVACVVGVPSESKESVGTLS
ncbi:Uncharacterized protein APZ42_017592 [Daphnia magna]|uniref:Uncharacterized protein n=1 Tax=Daphnia magna TaxID=35525 RepID=A0A162CKL0_9CRUS|nr:Uncharacterized protein APZ42_017592 [Daphnia magna]